MPRQIFHVDKMSQKYRDDWAKMRFQLWDQLPLKEHLVDINKMLRKSKRRGFVALDAKDTAIGFAETSLRDYASGCQSTPVFFLEGIWIASKFRRSGVAKLLVDTICAEILAMGYNELCSDTHIDNGDSQQAHLAWGFNESDRVVYFRKSLN